MRPRKLLAASRLWAVGLAVALALGFVGVADARGANVAVPVAASLTIAEGVRIGPVAVGGMEADEAEAAVWAAFDRPLRLALGGKRWQTRPAQLGARPAVARAVRQALYAQPGQSVALDVGIANQFVYSYVWALARSIGRPAVDPQVLLFGSRPSAAVLEVGVVVDVAASTAAVLVQLRGFDRATVELVHERVEPWMVESAAAAVAVVIKRASRELLFYKDGRLVRGFTVAVGLPEYPTPLGQFAIVSKLVDPTWIPPDSEWAKGLSPVGPGPDNPLGTRWLGLTSPEVGIHGTPEPDSLGTASSHGCIRMSIPEVEWLYDEIEVGTPVWVVEA